MQSQQWLKERFPQLEAMQQEPQNAAYEGCTFTIEGIRYRSRLAKRTPKKAGYFVAFWEKDEIGVNQAFHEKNSPEYLLVFTEDGNYFSFPREALIALGIVQTATKSGKMAMRVYPPHEQQLNKTATVTQRKQAPYYKKRR